MGTTVDIERYGIVNTAINTIVNALQGETWDRLLSRFAILFGLNRELTRSTGLGRTCLFTSSRERQCSPPSQMGASAKLRESMYTTSPNFLKLLLHPSPLRSSGRGSEGEKGSHDPPRRGSWTALGPPRSTCSAPP